MAYAHARGIVHRDIKPSNLLLDTEGVVWIADFGLAKGEDEGLTQSGDILGTLRYMSPERFRGEGDARADIYALGLTLYELLALRPGFDSSDRLKLIEQIKIEEPQKPRSIDARIPRDLETIVLEGDRQGPQGALPDRPRRWAKTLAGSSPTSRSGRARSAPPSATGGGRGAIPVIAIAGRCADGGACSWSLSDRFWSRAATQVWPSARATRRLRNGPHAWRL